MYKSSASGNANTRGDEMKENKKKEITMEQKVYGVLLGMGILALAGLTIFYGVKSQRTGDLVEQNIELGEQNPVSGPVTQTETPVTTEEDVQITEKVESTTESISKEEAREAVNQYSYNGTDKLSWPVNGNVLIPYSMDTTVYFETLDQYQCNPGLYIKAEPGTEVKACSGGLVKRVEENDRYGNLIIIDMGNGYEASYGQLSEVNLKKGDTVAQGAVIGKIAEPTNYFLLEGSHLYMKMTKDKKVVNPTDYFQP